MTIGICLQVSDHQKHELPLNFKQPFQTFILRDTGQSRNKKRLHV